MVAFSAFWQTKEQAQWVAPPPAPRQRPRTPALPKRHSGKELAPFRCRVQVHSPTAVPLDPGLLPRMLASKSFVQCAVSP